MSTLGDFPDVGDVLEGRYEIKRHIGRGGMGTVLEGYHLSLEREVAIKLMHPALSENEEYVRRFEREAQITKQLAHPNTVRTYDFGHTQSGMMFLVMELLEGRELSEELEQLGPMSIGRVLNLGRQLLDGLGEAHAKDIVHRDIKPGNLFLVQDRRQREVLKILDFGIAKPTGGGHTAITRANELIGTARYLAPEVFVNGEASKTSDIYACGMVLWEMLLGRPLIDAESIPAVFQQHLRLPHVMPPVLASHPLSIVLKRAVAKNPGLRFVDAEEMFEALEQIPDDAGFDEGIPDAQIEEIFEALHGESSRQTKETKTGTTNLINPMKDDTISEKGDGANDETTGTFTSEQTTHLLRDFVERTSQEVDEFVETMTGGPEETLPLDPKFLDRAVAASRDIARQFGSELPEETVEISEERIARAMARVRGATVAPEGIGIAGGNRRDPTSRVGAEPKQAQETEGTIELTEEFLSEISITAGSDSDGPERTIELSEEMILEGDVQNHRQKDIEVAQPRRARSRTEMDMETKMGISSQPDLSIKGGLGLHPVVVGAGIGLVVLLVLYGVFLLVT